MHFSNMHHNLIYRAIIASILQDGTAIDGRNGGTRQIPGISMKLNWDFGFPIISDRQMYYKSAYGEYLAFMNGCEYNRDFVEAGCNFWSHNLNDPEWQEIVKENGKPDDWLGRIYGAQWRGFNGDEEYVDQWRLMQSILLHNPYSRRAIMTSYNPSELGIQCLPPCHTQYQFLFNGERLDFIVTMRSLDVCVGLPYDWMMFKLMQYQMCENLKMIPGDLYVHVGSAHVYMVHADAIHELFKEPPRHDTYSLRKENGNWVLPNYPTNLRKISMEMVV